MLYNSNVNKETMGIVCHLLSLPMKEIQYKLEYEEHTGESQRVLNLFRRRIKVA